MRPDAVIDDDADVRDSLVFLLRRWGHGVVAGRGADELLGEQGLALDAVLAHQRLPAGWLQLRTLGRWPWAACSTS